MKAFIAAARSPLSAQPFPPLPRPSDSASPRPCPRAPTSATWVARRRSMPVSISIVLRYRNEAQLDQLVDQQSDPESPLFHHFSVTPNSTHISGRRPRSMRALPSSLARAGFRVNRVTGRTTSRRRRRRPSVGALFRYRNSSRLASGQEPAIRYFNVRPATIPADIDGATNAVLGFDTLTRVTPDHMFLPPAEARSI